MGLNHFGSPEAGNHVQLLHTVQECAGISALYTIALVFKFSPGLHESTMKFGRTFYVRNILIFETLHIEFLADTFPDSIYRILLD